MYQTAQGPVSDAEAAAINELNHLIWDNFWSIPRDQRTAEDWDKLQDIQILVKK